MTVATTVFVLFLTIQLPLIGELKDFVSAFKDKETCQYYKESLAKEHPEKYGPGGKYTLSCELAEVL